LSKRLSQNIKVRINLLENSNIINGQGQDRTGQDRTGLPDKSRKISESLILTQAQKGLHKIIIDSDGLKRIKRRLFESSYISSVYFFF
jgi:hypothetical protein